MFNVFHLFSYCCNVTSSKISVSFTDLNGKEVNLNLCSYRVILWDELSFYEIILWALVVFISVCTKFFLISLQGSTSMSFINRDSEGVVDIGTLMRGTVCGCRVPWYLSFDPCAITVTGKYWYYQQVPLLQLKRSNIVRSYS